MAGPRYQTAVTMREQEAIPRRPPSNKGRKMKRKLKPSEALFAAELTKPGMTRVQAARNVGLERVPASSTVLALRDELVAKQLVKADITTERVVLELARIGFADPRRMFNESGLLRQPHEWDDDTARALSGFDVEQRTEGKGEDTETYYVLKPRFWSKPEALKTLAQFAKLPGNTEQENAEGPSIRPTFVVNFVSAQVNVGG
jgi:phage terminase small subunit